MNRLQAPKKESFLSIFLLATVLLFLASVQAQNYSIPWYVAAPGGINQSSVNYGVCGTLTQAAIGGVASSNYRVAQGYWTAPGVLSVIPNLRTFGLPREYAFYPAQLNSARGFVTFRYDLPHASRVNLRIYNLSGTLVMELLNGIEQPGSKSVQWSSGYRIPAGVYLCRFQADEFRAGEKLLVR
jgi:hypothetical protein